MEAAEAIVQAMPKRTEIKRAAFLCGEAGIVERTIDNSAAYVASWLQRLKNDSKLVVTAAAQAQKAADIILGKAQHSEATEGGEQ